MGQEGKVRKYPMYLGNAQRFGTMNPSGSKRRTKGGQQFGNVIELFYLQKEVNGLN